MKKQYPCPMSPTGSCEHGGNKRFNYGFASGSASFCRHPTQGRFIDGMLSGTIKCPLYPTPAPLTKEQ